jgi:hypothetical protein
MIEGNGWELEDRDMLREAAFFSPEPYQKETKI